MPPLWRTAGSCLQNLTTFLGGWPRVGVFPTLGLLAEHCLSTKRCRDCHGIRKKHVVFWTHGSGSCTTTASRTPTFGHLHLLSQRPYLTSDQVCSVVLRALENTRARYGMRVYGFMLMPEHIHLLLSEPERGTLARALQSLKSASARMTRRVRAQILRARTPFWQTRYYDRYMRDFDEFSEKLRYIHRNPVKRGLCASPEHWLWSSFRHYWNGVDIGVEIESEGTARARQCQIR